jgi:general secretion pathway protein D
MSILVVMAGTFAGLSSTTASAQSAEQFSVYRLKGKSPTEARRMLTELLGDEAEDARIVADDDASELLVSGSPSIQKLAAKLVEQLNSSENTRPTIKRPSVETSAQDWEFSPITNPRATSDEKPASEEWPARETTRKKTAPKTDRNSILRDRTVRYRFRNITSQQAENAVSRLLGTRVLEIQDHQLSFSSGRNREVSLTFDDVSKSCLLEGSEDLVQQFAKLLQQLDDVRDQATDDTIRFVPLANVEPDVLNKALLIWKQTNRAPSKPEHDNEKGQGRKTAERVIRPAGFQQIPGEPAIPIETIPQQTSDSAANATMQDPADGALRRPSSDVTVEPLPDLDVLILRGRDPDVEELTRIIREIERLSEETAPEIDVVYLHNVQGEALEELITDVLDDLTGPLQGRVSITPLVKPNALLLIGWGEAVTAAKKLIARLDESVEPLTQMQIFSLKHASANQVENTVREFLNDRGGLGPEVNITADERTNSVIVNAAPRDLAEVTRLIEGLDKGTSESVNQARIVQLKNSLAADVSQTITAAITAARGGVGTQRSAALEMLMVGPDGNSVVASGLLQDVKLTPDSRTNRIFITGPADSLSLVEQLIKSLDESPAASAQIKVFQITNGDATDLVQVLRSLFPEQAGVSTVPQLATAEEESSLVPVRFSVDIRTNSIIATGTSGDLKIIEALLLRLDETDSQERVNEVYRLKNSPALDVANAVNNFLRSERVVNQAAPGRQNPFTQIESEVVVVPEPVGNALIISATPRYFEQIMELVEGLDAQPPQVMIQVILVEVELDNLHEFGVELGLQDSLLFDRSLLGSILTPGYNFNNQPLGNANTAGSLATRGNVGGQALSHFSLGRTSTDTDFGGLVLSASSENVSVLLRAMNQSRNVEILSRPQIMTLDNQPAFIQVGQRVPRIVGTSINQVGQVNTVELENVGLILGVTPRISPEGMVVMEIDAEKSEVGPEIDGIPVSISSTGEVIRSPRVNITTAQTTVSSASGQTIVIGGLITTNNTTLSRRVPWLSDVPVLGNLFRFDGTKNSRKELLIILTPHVVRGPSEAEYIKQVETARMSWISCDTFNWMNTDTAMVGQMDSSTIPTIYPDQTPGAASMQQAVPLTPSPDQFANPDSTSESINAPASPDTKVVVPEWKIETGEDYESQSTEGSGIKQMSFRSTSFKETDRKKTKNTTDPDSETQPRTKSKSEAKPKSEKKSFWSRE